MEQQLFKGTQGQWHKAIKRGGMGTRTQLVFT